MDAFRKCALSQGKCGHWQVLLAQSPGLTHWQRRAGQAQAGSQEQVVTFFTNQKSQLLNKPLLEVRYKYLS